MAFKMKAGKDGPMKKNFPDLNKDGKITQADILMGRGVFKATKADIISGYSSKIGESFAALGSDEDNNEEREKRKKERKRSRYERQEERKYKRKNR